MLYLELNRKIAQNKYAVYGSEKEKSEYERDLEAVSSCIYVCPTETKTRLYNYKTDSNGRFWNEFIRKINQEVKL